MKKELQFLPECVMRFDAVSDFLKRKGYKLEIGLFEDGTKIVESIDYDLRTNTLTGLVAPYKEGTGLPVERFFSAKNAQEIYESIKKFPRSSYLQVIMAQPNDYKAYPMILGYYGSDNRFTRSDVMLRYRYLAKEFSKRGVKVICVGSDGDSKFLAAQRSLVSFGSISHSCGFFLAGDINAPLKAVQDGLHDAKKLCDRLFDLGISLIMGNRVATVNHLTLVYKNFTKGEHKLIISDIDSNDSMNYG